MLQIASDWYRRCFLEIIMNRTIYIVSTLIFVAQFASAKQRPTSVDRSDLSASAIIQEINFARENPNAYAQLVAEARPLHQIERGRAVDEAVRFLKRARPLSPLSLSSGMCRAAADHCAEQASGEIGHFGGGHTSPGDRINRYGLWRIAYGENISYGQKTARAIVLTLVIDDGVRSRGHRNNIFNPKFNVAGIGYGPHARFGTVCTTDFAGAYYEHGSELVARNN